MVTPVLTLVGKQTSSEAEDLALARALIGGDPKATFNAWSRLQPQVARTMRRMLGPDTEIEDLVQEVFLRFFRKVRGLRDPGALRAFLTGICIRVSRKELTRRWLRRWLHLSPHGELPDEGTDAPDPDARQAVRRYYEILDRLGPEGRSLFVARNIQQLELAEVARAHGISISTAQRRLGRVTKRVAAMIAADPVLAGYAAGAAEVVS